MLTQTFTAITSTQFQKGKNVFQLKFNTAKGKFSQLLEEISSFHPIRPHLSLEW